MHLCHLWTSIWTLVRKALCHGFPATDAWLPLCGCLEQSMSCELVTPTLNFVTWALCVHLLMCQVTGILWCMFKGLRPFARQELDDRMYYFFRDCWQHSHHCDMCSTLLSCYLAPVMLAAYWHWPLCWQIAPLRDFFSLPLEILLTFSNFHLIHSCISVFIL